jgi:hypothetical protein
MIDEIVRDATTAGLTFFGILIVLVILAFKVRRGR